MNFSKLTWDTTSPSFSSFSETLRDLRHPVPWHACEDNCGTILDAGGDTVAVIDPENQRSDADAYQIAIWIVTAVNTCAGFTAVVTGTEH